MNKEDTDNILLKNNSDCKSIMCDDCYYKNIDNLPSIFNCKIFSYYNDRPFFTPDFFHGNDKLKVQIILKSRYKELVEILQ